MSHDTASKTIIETARTRFRMASDAEATMRRLQLEDKKFAAGEQWPDAIKRAREEDGRPCLTIDRLSAQIKQVTNALRKARPAVDITAASDGDVETADVLSGIIRHIEQTSDADVAYDQAGSDAATIGRGYFRILTDYDADDGYTQDIKIARIRNPFTVYFDPTCQKIDYADARFCFVVEDLPRSEYELLYPTSRAAGMSAADFSSIGDDIRQWYNEDTIRVAEYWYVESTFTDLKLPTGKTRKVERRKVVCKKINAVEVLEAYDWAGKYIPIVPVIGEEVDIEGVVDYRGIVRRAKDPQRASNYWKSAATESIALAPKAPFIMAEGQDEGYEAMWAEANTKNFPALKYKPTTVMGQLAAPPQRSVAEPPIQAIMTAIVASENDLRATTGFFDVGERESREQSGKAIMARQRMGELGNSDYGDGLRRAIRHCGRILVDLIPHIYDVPRVRRITGKDNKEQTVMVYAGQANAPQQDNPEIKAFDLSQGKYDVVVSAGQSFQTARQEFIELMAPMFQAKPELFQMFGDIFFDNLDVPYAKQMAARAKKMLPPQLQDDQPGQPEIPPQVQMQMQQMDQQLQQVSQAAQQMQQQLESKVYEVESRERIEAAKLALEERIAAMKNDLEHQKALLDAQTAQMQIDAEGQRTVLKANVDIEQHAVDLRHDAEQRDAERATQAEPNFL
ncbi:MAG TPA: portal protein [Gemmatimonadaceae bacterium]|nr:portal protein [Gemmatimonadaceae bacterium]